jgi:hypothetical protein
MRASLNVKKAQMSNIKSEWQKGWDEMCVEYSTTKDKGLQEFGKKMDRLEMDPGFKYLKGELLRLYLEKVRYVYALAFFQWRKSIQTDKVNDKDIKMIFDERRDSIIV